MLCLSVEAPRSPTLFFTSSHHVPSKRPQASIGFIHYYVATYRVAPAFRSRATPAIQPPFLARDRGVSPSLLESDTLAPRFSKLVMTLVLQKMLAHIRGVLPVTPASSIGIAAFSTSTSAKLVCPSKIAVVNAFKATLLFAAPCTSVCSTIAA